MEPARGHMLPRLVCDDSPDIMAGTVAEDDLRPPRIVEREAADGNAFQGDQGNALRPDLVQCVVFSVRGEWPQMAGECSTQQAGCDRENQIPFLHAISPVFGSGILAMPADRGRMASDTSGC